MDAGKSGPAQRAQIDNEARREVLKRFGRYAAAAPTVMLLLAPRSGNSKPARQPKGGHENDGGY
jgi:hypothetical protein